MAKGLNNISKVLGKIYAPTGDAAIGAMRKGVERIQKGAIVQTGKRAGKLRKHIKWNRIGEAASDTAIGAVSYLGGVGSGYTGLKRLGVATARTGAAVVGVSGAARMAQGRAPWRDRRGNFSLL